MSRKPDIADDGDDMPTAPFWMSTFSDMATLLMTFFILIVAMSEVKVQKFEEALSYFNGRPGLLTHDAIIPSMQQQELTQLRTMEEAKRYEALLNKLAEAGLNEHVEIDLTGQGLHVRITDSVMFAPAQAVLLGPSQEVLREVAAVLGDAVESVHVEGHTDDQPINSPTYPSNWELSGARASAVVRYLLTLQDARPAERYSAIGRGEFHPIATNETAEGRAQNRRVEIYFSTEPWQSQRSPWPTP